MVPFIGNFLSSFSGSRENTPSSWIAAAAAVPSKSAEENALQNVVDEMTQRATSLSYGLAVAYSRCYGLDNNEIVCDAVASVRNFLNTEDELQGHLFPPLVDQEVIVKYLSPKQRELINECKVTQKDLRVYLELFYSPKGPKKLSVDYENRDMNPILALYAWQTDKITLNQLMTQVLTSAVLNQIPALPSEIQTYHFNEQFPLLQEFLRFNKVGEEYFKKKLELVPLSEQYFSVVKLPIGPITPKSPVIHALMSLPKMFVPVKPYKTDLNNIAQSEHVFVLSTTMYRLYVEMGNGFGGEIVEMLQGFMFRYPPHS